MSEAKIAVLEQLKKLMGKQILENRMGDRKKKKDEDIEEEQASLYSLLMKIREDRKE